MTAWLTVSQRRHLRHLAETSSTSEEEILLSTIETYINTNQDTYLNDDLLHVSYIGDRSTTEQEVDAGLDTSKIEINPPNDDGMNPGMIGLAVAMAVLAVIAALVGVAYHRRRQQRQQQFSPGPDLEEGAFPSYGLTPESESLGNSTEAAVNEENVAQKDLFGLAGVAKSDDDIEEEEEEDADDKEQASPKPSAASSLAALGAATVIARELSYYPMVVAPRAEEEEEDVVVEEVDTSSDDTEEEVGIQESTSFASAVTPVASPHQNPEHSFSDIVPTMSPMTDGVEEEEETSQQSSEDSSFFVDTAANTNVTSDQSHIDAVHNLMFGGEDKENAAPPESFDDDRGIV